MRIWNDIVIEGIAKIEKLVGEFNIVETITPYGKFKVKIYEDKSGKYTGITNLQIKDEDGCPFAGVGYGETIEEALKDTIMYFLEMIKEKEGINKEDFQYSDPFDF